MYSIYFYKNNRGDSEVINLINEFNKKSKAKIARYLLLLEQEGPDLLRPYADHVKGKIRELRVRVEEGNIRLFYYFFFERKIILLHAFKKKTQELPEREINQAQRNLDDFLMRYNQGDIVV